MFVARFRVGIDIGGTFTDFVLLEKDGTRMVVHKRLTTPDDPSRSAALGFSELLEAAGASTGDVELVVHGTTLVTNAIIERKGARVGLLTTRGFRDTLEIGREQRYDIYDLALRFPDPLVPRDVRFEVEERCAPGGEILTPLREDDVRSAIHAMVEHQVEAVAVCFLHAYRNPAHERRAAEIIRAQEPRLAISLSSDVAPEIGEYERFVTTAANAYVQPLVTRYLRRLQTALHERGFGGELLLMQSSGGNATLRAAEELPVRLMESGPAGGALAAAYFGRQLGRPRLLAFDMGGTTAKASLIEDGRPQKAPAMEAARVHRFKRGSGLPIRIPVVDLIEIGAGGGSIAHISPLGLLKVGPESAGASPGPACYGLGGHQATVTDANLALGYLGSESFLGGRMALSESAAESALQELGKTLGLTAIETASGIFSIVCENMAAAARAHIIEQGQDPRRYAMMAFGGAGPAHACRVAHILGLPEVIVPLAAGAASALGFLAAPLSFSYVTSLPQRLDALDWQEAESVLASMEDRGRALLADAGVEGCDVTCERSVDMRFLGQVHEITVPLPPGPTAKETATTLQAAFEQEYRRLYARVPEGNPPEVRSFRVNVRGTRPEPRPPALLSHGQEQSKRTRRCHFPDTGFTPAPVFDRDALASGFSVPGPAIIEETEATTVVPPGDTLTVDDLGNLHIAIGKGGSAA